MKKITTLLAGLAVVGASLMAETVPVIKAKKVNEDLSQVSYKSDVWNSVPSFEVVLYPQTTIHLNDKKANELNKDNKARKAEVKAVYNDKQIALWVEWPDSTMNVQSGYKTTSFADGFAVQFASAYNPSQELPYIGMGNEGRPVAVYLQKAVKGFFIPDGDGNVYYQLNRQQTELFGPELEKFDEKVKSLGNNDYERAFVSEGFRSMTEIKGRAKYNSYARLRYKDGKWTGTLARPLNDPYADIKNGAAPVAFAVWDGAKMGRNGLKFLTQWLTVELSDTDAAKQLVVTTTDQPKGDAAAGKEAVAANGCNGCHQITESDPENYMAPGLMNIGGYATTAYLKESLLTPSAVVVPGYNRNAHVNYPWYNIENGKRVSTMTSYEWLDAQTLENIVTYLKTLKAEVE